MLLLDLLQVARLMRMRPLDTDTVGARGLEKQNGGDGGGSRNKQVPSHPSILCGTHGPNSARSLSRDFKAILLK